MKEGNRVIEFPKLVAIAISGFRSASNKMGKRVGGFRHWGPFFRRVFVKQSPSSSDSKRIGRNYQVLPSLLELLYQKVFFIIDIQILHA